MDILLLTFEFHPTNGGVGNATLALARALRDHQGDRISVIDCRSWWPWEKPALRETWEGFDVTRIKYTGLPEQRPLRQTVRSLLCFLRLCIRIRALAPDVIIAQRVYDLGWFAGLIGRVLQIPVFAYAHGPDDIQHAERIALRRRLTVWTFGLTRCVFVTNTYFRRILLRFAPRARIEIVPNVCIESLGAGEPPRNARQPDGVYHVACVGRMLVEYGIEIKGFSHAIAALRCLPDVVLHFFGDGPQRPDLERLAFEADVASRVVFHGRVDHQTLLDALGTIDLLLHPALVEGLPMTVLEAMAAGLPVLATEVGGLPDVLLHGETGYLIPPGDSGAIADAIRSILDDPTGRHAVAEHAVAYIRDYSSAQRIAARIHDVIAGYTT
jgi:glycosyltransferase involved in cell wall biosynthesis